MIAFLQTIVGVFFLMDGVSSYRFFFKNYQSDDVSFRLFLLLVAIAGAEVSLGLFMLRVIPI